MANGRGEFNLGIILPTLIESLKSILDQYPDDGQILKELVQNADDAGARTVRFVWDENEYPSDNIYRSEHTSQFQGPALLAYNDAPFTRDDLDGIRMIQKSVKREDALKVGRFGLGFKSVFHMTDLVGLVTKYGIAFIDPHEELYHVNRDSGRSTSSYLWDPDRELEDMKQYADQWLPFYHDIFRYDKSVLEGGRQSSYGGTIFRFPFRKKASNLSSKVYSSTDVKRLLDSLRKEGHLYLLFLKSLECIEFHHKPKDAAEPTLVYRASIAEEDKATVRRERSAFFGRIGVSASTAYKCNITTELHNGNVQRDNRFSYLVGLHMDYGAQLAAYSSKLKCLPTMGAALSLNGPDLEVSSGGQLFCFLPMPLEAESPTGMNVHVHGYFALDQHRRHLKMPSAEQKDDVKDEQLIWNGLLIRELLPKCLIGLILGAVQDPSINHHVYELFPVSSLMRNDFWRAVLPAFYAMLQPLSVFRGSNGQFVRVTDAVFQDEVRDSELPILGKVVAAAGNNYVVVSSNVLSELQSQIRVTTLNAQLVSWSAKEVRQTLTETEKLQLLRYFLEQKDAATHLLSLELLPLENGPWGSLSFGFHASDFARKFSGTGSRAAGLACLDEGKSLLRKQDWEGAAGELYGAVLNMELLDGEELGEAYFHLGRAHFELAGTEESQDNGEEPTNLQLSWKMFELARKCLKLRVDNLPAEDERRMLIEDMLSETYGLLGQVFMKNKIFEQAVEDLTTCLRRRQKLMPEDSRSIVEAHFQLGVALGFSTQFELAVDNLKEAIRVLELRVANLQKKTAGEGEIKEIQTLIPEIREKIADTLNMKEETVNKINTMMDKAAEALQQNGDAETNGSSSSASEPAKDITSLVRKRKKSTEDAADEETNGKKQHVKEEPA